MSNHFAAVANDYAKFRPGYPPALYECLQTYIKPGQTVWDVGCGNGQASVALADLGAQVIATDSSIEQLQQARSHPHVSYLLAPAEQAPLSVASVDAITVAQALHWFDLPRFNQQVKRVLRPQGWLFVWTYQPIAAHNVSLQKRIADFYQREAMPWWPPGREHVDNGYAELELAFADRFQQQWTMEQTMSRAEFCGYVRTWSAMAKQRAATGVDAVAQLDHCLCEIWPDDTVQSLYWPLRLRACQYG